MNCDELAALLNAEIDGEVDRLRSHALHRHAETCPSCGPRVAAALQLRQQLREQLPYHRAPAALRQRLAAQAASVPRAPRPARTTVLELDWRSFAGGLVAGLLAAALAWALGTAWWRERAGEDLSARVVGLHTRATLANRLLDVPSSDRHQVKPWLSARMDYSIPVVDWAASGFPLQGARIDHLDGHTVATLVYRRRQHVIDVFVRPESAADVPPSVHAVRGFNVVIAHGVQMQWLATSDLNAAELDGFVKALASGTAPPATP